MYIFVCMSVCASVCACSGLLGQFLSTGKRTSTAIGNIICRTWQTVWHVACEMSGMRHVANSMFSTCSSAEAAQIEMLLDCQACVNQASHKCKSA